MPLSKYSLQFICFLILITSDACTGKKADSDSKNSLLENNPAYSSLNDSIRKFPKDPLLYLHRANRLSQENAHELAYSDFLRAWEMSRGLEFALPFAANLEILGKHLERLRLLDTLSHDFPGNTQVSRLLAEAYAGTGNHAQALIQYNKMLAKDSLDPEIFYEKALLLEQLNDTPGAIQALQSAYTMQNVDTYGLELAHLFAEQKNPRALEICNFILRQDSSELLIDPFFIKGIYFSNIKQYKKAIAQFDSCINRDWKTTDAYLEKGRAYFQMQNIQDALQTFNMAITVTNTDPDAYYWQGRCYEAQHRPMDAIVSYRKAISLEKDFTEASRRLQNLDSGFVHPSH